MLISRVSTAQPLSFKRALTENEMKEYKQVAKEAKEKIGQTGLSVLILHDPCLPQSPQNNTGMASLASKDSQDFVQYMKNYLGINTIETLPSGEPDEIKYDGKYYNPYKSASLSLSPHYIDLNFLAEKNLISIDDIAALVGKNTDNKTTLANFKNIVNEGSLHDNIMKKAYLNFLKLAENSPLRKEFEEFKRANNDWLEPKSLYKAISAEYGNNDYKTWSKLDQNLYKENSNLSKTRKQELLTTYADKNAFYAFKQFLAEKSLLIARKELNGKGLKLYGDFQVNFSKDEVWGNPDAFNEEYYVVNPEWKIPALKFEEIENNQSAASKLFKRKAELFAKRYDGIRVDVGWGYTRAKLVSAKDKSVKFIELGEIPLKILENKVKEVQKENFKPENIVYEVEAGEKDFSLFENDEIIPEFKNRIKIITQEFLNDGWASHYNLTVQRGLDEDYLLLGASNHDCTPIRNIAFAHDPHGLVSKSDMEVKKQAQVEALSNIFGIPTGILNNPVEFMRAKFAESMGAKNHMLYITDVFGRSENLNPSKKFAESFRYKVPENYKEAYHKAVQSGLGFNLMDSIEKIFRQKGLDETEPKLYDKVVKFANILYQPD